MESICTFPYSFRLCIDPFRHSLCVLPPQPFLYINYLWYVVSQFVLLLSFVGRMWPVFVFSLRLYVENIRHPLHQYLPFRLRFFRCRSFKPPPETFLITLMKLSTIFLQGSRSFVSFFLFLFSLPFPAGSGVNKQNWID